MSEKKILPISPTPPHSQVDLSYFVNEIFWNLLFHSQLEKAQRRHLSANHSAYAPSAKQL